MVQLYRYTDASGNENFAYTPASQLPAMLEAIRQSGGTGAKMLGTFESEFQILEDSRFSNAQSTNEIMRMGKAEDPNNPDSTEETFADLGNMGATLRNFLTGQGIDAGGIIEKQASQMLLPAAQAALGFGQGLAPASADTLNLSQLLSSGGLGGIAQQSRNVFNQLANSGGQDAAPEGEAEGSFQRPATSGSDLAGNTRNLALGALFERSPFFAAMFGNNAVSQASD